MCPSESMSKRCLINMGDFHTPVTKETAEVQPVIRITTRDTGIISSGNPNRARAKMATSTVPRAKSTPDRRHNTKPTESAEFILSYSPRA